MRRMCPAIRVHGRSDRGHRAQMPESMTLRSLAYFFRLYALPERAGLPPGFSAQDPGPFLDGAPAKATLVGTFGTFGR